MKKELEKPRTVLRVRSDPSEKRARINIKEGRFLRI
jgi:hypothetical protein